MLGHEVASACDSFDLLERHCALAVQMARTHTAAMAVLARLTGGVRVSGASRRLGRLRLGCCGPIQHRSRSFAASAMAAGSLSVVAVGMLADEVDHLAIAAGSLSAPHAPSCTLGKPRSRSRGLGLVELGGANKLHHGIGGGIKRVFVGVFLLGPGEAGGDCCRQLSDMQATRRGERPCASAISAIRRARLAAQAEAPNVSLRGRRWGALSTKSWT
jgi:hypothetical protein